MNYGELMLILENAQYHMEIAQKSDDAVAKVQNLVKSLEFSIKANEIMMNYILKSLNNGN